MDRVLHGLQRLELDAGYVVVSLTLGALLAGVVLWAEIWGSTRARRRTERAISDARSAHAREVRT